MPVRNAFRQAVARLCHLTPPLKQPACGPARCRPGPRPESWPKPRSASAIRGGRWCQGKLRNIRLLSVPVLHPPSRSHLLRGAIAYLASVWCAALFILWALQGQGRGLQNIFADSSLLPTSPVLPPVTQAAITGLVGLMRVAPKLIGSGGYRRGTGLPPRTEPRFLGLVLAEVIVSALLAPALMVRQVQAKPPIVRGRYGGWMPHSGTRNQSVQRIPCGFCTPTARRNRRFRFSGAGSCRISCRALFTR